MSRKPWFAARPTATRDTNRGFWRALISLISALEWLTAEYKDNDTISLIISNCRRQLLMHRKWHKACGVKQLRRRNRHVGGSEGSG
jgi:hypothetical protein